MLPVCLFLANARKCLNLIHSKNSSKVMKVCVLCRESTTDDLSEVTKGLQTLIDFSYTRGKEEFHDYLLNKQQLKASGHEVKVLVHKSCRRDFVNKRRSTQNETESEDSLAKKQRLTSLR